MKEKLYTIPVMMRFGRTVNVLSAVFTTSWNRMLLNIHCVHLLIW